MTGDLKSNSNSDQKAHCVRLGLIQHACTSDREANLQTATDLINQAADRDCQVVVTQELFTSCYFPQIESHAGFELAESIPGPTTNALSQLANDRRIHLIGSIFETAGSDVFYNSLVAIDSSGSVIGKYRKMHIPDDPLFHEKFYFAPGNLGFQTVTTSVGRIGLLICWDQWFPEAARLTALQGAQILIYPSAIGYIPQDSPQEHRQQLHAWKTVQQGHAISNGVFVAAINRTGVEDQVTFWGNSFVVDPYGQIIAEAGSDQNQVLVVDCELALIDEARSGWPFMRDRRTDAYGNITSTNQYP